MSLSWISSGDIICLWRRECTFVRVTPEALAHRGTSYSSPLFYWRRGQAICIKIPLLLRPFTHAPTWRKLQNTELEYKRATTAFWTTFPIKGKQQFTCCLCSPALVGLRNLPRRCESPYRYQIRAGNLIFLPRSLQWTLCKYR